MPPKPAFTLGKLPQRSFDHLIDIGKKRAGKNIPVRVNTRPAYVPPKDRIPLWNIAAKDTVRVISGKMKGKTGTVDYVERDKNRVYLVESDFCRAKPVPTSKKGDIFNNLDFIPDQKIYRGIPIHYSNLALVLKRSAEQEARDEYAQSQGSSSSSSSSSPSSSSSSSSVLPEVYAKRLRATNVHYDWRRKRWTWRRLAESVGEVDRTTGHTRAVEWEKNERYAAFKPMRTKLPSRAGPSDTPYEEASRATFVPPVDPTTEPPKELNIRDIEFFNYYGRAKRNERWHAAREAEETLSSSA